MRYFLDTEFNGFGGAILSMSLVREDGESLYIRYAKPKEKIVPWVHENVMPLMLKLPKTFPGRVAGCPNDPIAPDGYSEAQGAKVISWYLSGYGGADPNWKPGVPHIIADWPDDIAYFCKALMTGPGEMVPVPHFTCEVNRAARAWPTTLPIPRNVPREGGGEIDMSSFVPVQHNSYWDAKALWWWHKERGLLA